jgi:hypothetical protein
VTVVAETISAPPWSSHYGFPVFKSASAILSIIGATGLTWLMALEYKVLPKPSHMSTVYILGITFSDIISLSLSGVGTRVEKASSLPAVLHLAVCVVLLVLECLSEDVFFLGEYNEPLTSPEWKAGLLGRTFFWWINPLLAKGYREMLQSHCLPTLDPEITSENLRRSVLHHWDKQRGSYFPPRQDIIRAVVIWVSLFHSMSVFFACSLFYTNFSRSST